MPKTPELVAAIAPALGIAPGTVRRHVRYLREAGLLPSGYGRGGHAEVEPEHAANLLISLMASHEANHGAAAAQVIGDLPAQSETLFETGGGKVTSETRHISDWPIPPGDGEAITNLTFSLRLALSTCFLESSLDVPNPINTLNIGLEPTPTAGLDYQINDIASGLIVYGLDDPDQTQPALRRLAFVTGDALAEIGALFGGGSWSPEEVEPEPALAPVAG